MIEEKLGIITNVKITTVPSKASDGADIKIPICEFKVESGDVDYDTIEKYFPDIYAHLNVNGRRNVINTCKFDCKMYDLNFEFFRQAKGEEKSEDIKKYLYEKITLDSVTVSYKENIPTFGFVLRKQIEKTDFYLSNAAKINLYFTLNYSE